MAMKQKPRILLVDDDLVPGASFPNGGYMWYYAQAFRDDGFNVSEADGVDNAIEQLRRCATEELFDIVALDVMMAAGKTLRNSESDPTGMQTGILFAEWLGREFPTIPVVVLSLRNRSTIEQPGNKPKNVKRVFTKKQCAPFEFVAEIKTILDKGANAND